MGIVRQYYNLVASMYMRGCIWLKDKQTMGSIAGILDFAASHDENFDSYYWRLFKYMSERSGLKNKVYAQLNIWSRDMTEAYEQEGINIKDGVVKRMGLIKTEYYPSWFEMIYEKMVGKIEAERDIILYFHLCEVCKLPIERAFEKMKKYRKYPDIMADAAYMTITYFLSDGIAEMREKEMSDIVETFKKDTRYMDKIYDAVIEMRETGKTTVDIYREHAEKMRGEKNREVVVKNIGMKIIQLFYYMFSNDIFLVENKPLMKTILLESLLAYQCDAAREFLDSQLEFLQNDDILNFMGNLLYGSVLFFDEEYFTDKNSTINIMEILESKESTPETHMTNMLFALQDEIQEEKMPEWVEELWWMLYQWETTDNFIRLYEDGARFLPEDEMEEWMEKLRGNKTLKDSYTFFLKNGCYPFISPGVYGEKTLEEIAMEEGMDCFHVAKYIIEEFTRERAFPEWRDMSAQELFYELSGGLLRLEDADLREKGLYKALAVTAIDIRYRDDRDAAEEIFGAEMSNNEERFVDLVMGVLCHFMGIREKDNCQMMDIVELGNKVRVPSWFDEEYEFVRKMTEEKRERDVKEWILTSMLYCEADDIENVWKLIEKNEDILNDIFFVVRFKYVPEKLFGGKLLNDEHVSNFADCVIAAYCIDRYRAGKEPKTHAMVGVIKLVTGRENTRIFMFC